MVIKYFYLQSINSFPLLSLLYIQGVHLRESLLALVARG